MPKIDAWRGGCVARSGVWGEYCQFNDGTNGIAIHPYAPNPELTAIHELGHFIDHHALKIGIYASQNLRLLEE